jgi:hypothetical protein
METPSAVLKEFGRIIVVKKDGTEGSFCPINGDISFGRSGQFYFEIIL